MHACVHACTHASQQTRMHTNIRPQMHAEWCLMRAGEGKRDKERNTEETEGSSESKDTVLPHHDDVNCQRSVRSALHQIWRLCICDRARIRRRKSPNSSKPICPIPAVKHHCKGHARDPALRPVASQGRDLQDVQDPLLPAPGKCT